MLSKKLKKVLSDKNQIKESKTSVDNKIEIKWVYKNLIKGIKEVSEE